MIYRVSNSNDGSSGVPKLHTSYSQLERSSIPLDTSAAGLHTYTFISLSDAVYSNHSDFISPIVQQEVKKNPGAVFLEPNKVFKYCTSGGTGEDQEIMLGLTGQAPFTLEVEINHEVSGETMRYEVGPIDPMPYSLVIPQQYLELGAQELKIMRIRDASGCEALLDSGDVGHSARVELYDAPRIRAVTHQTDYCENDTILFAVSGIPPFDIHYEFNGQDGLVPLHKNHEWVWERARPGRLTVVAINDQVCENDQQSYIDIHPMPSVSLAGGSDVIVEGDTRHLQFTLMGTPPFKLSYRRSLGEGQDIVEDKVVGSYDNTIAVSVSDPGFYEPVAVEDLYCRAKGY